MSIDTIEGCYCVAGPGPHSHGAKPASPRPEPTAADDREPLGVAVLPPFAAVPGDGFLPPRPPAQIPQQDTRPLNTPQVNRRDCVRLALDYYTRLRKTDPDVVDVIRTADALAEYIRSGTIPTSEQET